MFTSSPEFSPVLQTYISLQPIRHLHSNTTLKYTSQILNVQNLLSPLTKCAILSGFLISINGTSIHPVFKSELGSHNRLLSFPHFP